MIAQLSISGKIGICNISGNIDRDCQEGRRIKTCLSGNLNLGYY